MTRSAEPQRVWLQHVPGIGACIEALGLFVDGFVEDKRVAARDFIFELPAERDHGVRFDAKLRHPASENPPSTIIGALYNLMAGFFKAGADVEINGPLSALLPGAGRLHHDPHTRPVFLVRQIFEDRIQDAERTKAIEPAVLEEIHDALEDGLLIGDAIDDPDFRAMFPSAAKDPRSEITWLLTHSSGLEVAVLTKDGAAESHCILKHRPQSSGRMFGFPIPQAKQVRSWGDAWIGHSWGGRRTRPEGLEILPDEVAIIHDVSAYRYRIADRVTLNNLSMITFGTGPSPYAAQVWLGMADQCGEVGNHDLAARCCDEAALCGEDTATTAFAKAEAVYWRDWLTWSVSHPRIRTAPMDERQPSPVRPVSELIERLGPDCAEKLNDIVRAMRFEREDAHDHRRRVNWIDAWPETGQGSTRFSLDYKRLTGRDLIASRIPLPTLAHLGASADPIPPPARYPAIFTLRCGDAVVWGSVETGCLVLLSDPAIAYSIDRR